MVKERDNTIRAFTSSSPFEPGHSLYYFEWKDRTRKDECPIMTQSPWQRVEKARAKDAKIEETTICSNPLVDLDLSPFDVAQGMLAEWPG